MLHRVEAFLETGFPFVLCTVLLTQIPDWKKTLYLTGAVGMRQYEVSDKRQSNLHYRLTDQLIALPIKTVGRFPTLPVSGHLKEC